jgi:hypothetical protein
MHDASDDDLFSQLLQFKDSPYRNEVLFDNSSPVQRAHLESSAYMLGLEYEYSSISKRVRILRPEEELAQEFEEQDEYDEEDSVQDDMSDITTLSILEINSNDWPSDTRANFGISPATPIGRLFSFSTERGEASMELPPEMNPGDEFLNFDPLTTTEGNGELDNFLNTPSDQIFGCDGHTTMSSCDWEKELSYVSFEPGTNEMPNPISSLAGEAHWNDFDMQLDKTNDLDTIDAFFFEESSVGYGIPATDMEKRKSSRPPSLPSSTACAMEERFQEDCRSQSGFGIFTSAYRRVSPQPITRSPIYASGDPHHHHTRSPGEIRQELVQKHEAKIVCCLQNVLLLLEY